MNLTYKRDPDRVKMNHRSNCLSERPVRLKVIRPNTQTHRHTHTHTHTHHRLDYKAGKDKQVAKETA